MKRLIFVENIKGTGQTVQTGASEANYYWARVYTKSIKTISGFMWVMSDSPDKLKSRILCIDNFPPGHFFGGSELYAKVVPYDREEK